MEEVKNYLKSLATKDNKRNFTIKTCKTEITEAFKKAFNST